MSKVAAQSQVKANIDEVKAKMAQTSSEYVPVEKASDPWTIQSAAPVTTMEQAVETVKAVLGGTAIDESCIHGNRIWKTGTTKAGKQWAAWDCCYKASNYQVGQEKPCEPERIWLEVSSNGTWVPQKGR
jgi:hypothetical protein